MLRLSDYLYKNEELNMKRTIKLTESELHMMIAQAINEVKYGGMPLHGTNQDDWTKVYNLRRDRYHKAKQYTPEEEKELNAAVRNRNNARQLGGNGKNNEPKLENIVRESLRKTINEGHWDSKVADDWAYVRETVGDDTMLSELYNYLSGDQIEDFLYDHIGRYYDEVNFDEPEEL